MNKTIVNVKTDPKVKKDAQKIASRLGLSLSGVVNVYLRQFVRTQTLFISLGEPEPSLFLEGILKKAKKERQEKKHYSFKTTQEAIDFLDK